MIEKGIQPKNNVIRVDASHSIGTGHLIRCLTLAESLRQAGFAILFKARNLPGNLNKLIKANGCEVCVLPHPKVSKDQKSGRSNGIDDPERTEVYFKRTHQAIGPKICFDQAGLLARETKVKTEAGTASENYDLFWRRGSNCLRLCRIVLSKILIKVKA